MIDWKHVTANWGDILQKIREHKDRDAPVAFDDYGSILTSNRPLIESMISAYGQRSNSLQYYFEYLGMSARKPRVFNVGIRQRMPFMTGGKAKKKKK